MTGGFDPERGAAILAEIVRLNSQYDFGMYIYEFEDSIADYYIWRELMEDACQAIAAGTRSAETSETSAPSEGCQSGPKGIARKDAA